MTPPHMTSIAAVAFNRGCQSRLDGEPLSANPYNSSEAGTAHAAWTQGWIHTHRYFGVDARHEYRPLPEVGECHSQR